MNLMIQLSTNGSRSIFGTVSIGGHRNGAMSEPCAACPINIHRYTARSYGKGMVA